MKIRVEGSYYDQGFRHGQEARQLIAKNLDIVRQILREKDADMRVYDQALARHYENVFQLDADLKEELRGIADGAGMELYDIEMLNANFYFFADRMRAVTEDCSVIIAGPKMTLDHKTYFIKNRDMHNRFHHVVLERRFDDGTVITEMDIAGVVTFLGSGINNSGLAATTTGVWSPNIPLELSLIGNLKYSFSPHTLLRYCHSVDEALRFMEGKNPYKVSRSNLFLIDETRAVVVETTEGECRVMDWEQDILVRSNHFLHPDLAKFNPDRENYPSTFMRYERALEMLRAKQGALRFQDMLEIASDHANGANSICRHGEEGGAVTVCSSITVVEDRKSWVSLRNPCESLISCNALE